MRLAAKLLPRFAPSTRSTLSALSVLPLVLFSCGGGSPPRPHLVLLTVDTLRADHLSFYGYPRATSPRLDELARGATVFDETVTVIPKTGPSFTTMFTGRHPSEHGVRYNFTEVPAGLPVLAERLRDAGYRTAAFVGNPVLRANKRYDRGFDTFRQFSKEEGVEGVKRAFLDWARGEWDRPTFVWIHFIDPHGPYEPLESYEKLFLDDELAQGDERVSLDYEVLPGGHRNKVLHALPDYHHRPDGEDRVAKFVARYDAEIRYVDDACGEVLDALRARGLFDPSAVVFTSDHGESLGEHDFWFEHGWFAYEPGLRIPLFVKRPGQREGERVATPASTLDYLPTFLRLVGLPPDPAGEGEDLLATGFPRRAERPPVVVESSDEYPEKFHGLRDGRWKYLRRASDGREELYDLEADPRELDNLAAREPQRTAALRALLDERLEALRARALEAREGAADDAAAVEELESLGYGGDTSDAHDGER